ncbi:MAG: peptidoglycan-binding domain-containing protein [Pseudomonadota bacterium]
MFRLTLFFACLTASVPAVAQENIILELETNLSFLGYDPGPIDGLPSSELNAAVSAYQIDRGLQQTGMIDFALLERIAEEAKPESAETSSDLVLSSEVIDGFTYHTLEGTCDGDRGLAHYTYFEGLSKIELSEVCVLQSEGRIVSSEEMRGFTLVRDSLSYQQFDIMESGDAEHNRQSFKAGNFDEAVSEGVFAQVWFPFQHKVGWSKYGHVGRQHTTSSMTGSGFTYKHLFQNSGNSEPFHLSIGMYLFDTAASQNSPNSQANVRAPVSFSGPAGVGRFENGQLIVEFKEGELPDRSDNGRLILYAEPDGSLSGEANFETLNLNVGEYSGEWLSARFSLTNLRGVWIGEQGQQLRLLGFGEAYFNGTEGTGAPIQVRATISGISVPKGG